MKRLGMLRGGFLSPQRVLQTLHTVDLYTRCLVDDCFSSTTGVFRQILIISTGDHRTAVQRSIENSSREFFLLSLSDLKY